VTESSFSRSERGICGNASACAQALVAAAIDVGEFRLLKHLRQLSIYLAMLGSKGVAAVPSRIVLKLADAAPRQSRISDQAARSIG
jgi:hypothetical protein